MFVANSVYSNPIVDWNHNPLVTETDFTGRYVDTTGNGTVDTRVDLALDFLDDNLITEALNQTMVTATGNDWVEWSPSTTLAIFSINNAGSVGTVGKLHIVGTTGTNPEGAYLAVGNLTTPVVGHTYEVSCKLKAASAMAEQPFSIEYAGDTRQIGDITTTEALYKVHLKAANTTGGLYIYYTGNSEVAWTIDSVTVSLTSIKLSVAGSGYEVGDVLKINSSELVRIVKTADPFFHVERAYGGTSMADAIISSGHTAVEAQTVTFKQIDTASSTSTSGTSPKPQFITKDFDFDKPGIVKKVYKIFVTYKNPINATLSNPITVSADGNTTFSSTNIISGQSIYSSTNFTDITQSSQININTTTITMDGANNNIDVGMVVTDSTKAIPYNTKILSVSDANPQVFTIDKYLTKNIAASTTLTFHQIVKPSLIGRINANVTTWEVATFTFTEPLQCQSLALQFNQNDAVNSVHINDITFEFREIHRRVS